MTITPTSPAMAASRRRKPPRLQAEDPEGDHACQQPGDEKRNAEDEVEADRGAHELGEVGGHRDHLRLQPQEDDDREREAVAADLGQAAAGRDAELGAHRLDQHRHQVGGQDDPQQHVAELRAPGHVGGEVAGVDVRDRRDEGRAQKRQDRAQPPTLAVERALGRPEDPRLARQRVLDAEHLPVAGWTYGPGCLNGHSYEPL